MQAVSEQFNPLFLTSGLIVDDASEVLDAELRLVAVLGWDVVSVELVLRVEFVQHGGVRALCKRKQNLSHLFFYSFKFVCISVLITFTLQLVFSFLFFSPWGTCSPRR